MTNLKEALSALELAVLAGLVVVRTPQGRAVLEYPALWVGPDASDDAIATIACRRLLRQKRDVEPSERAVRRMVARAGFRFEANARV